jgi:hypothetical protein
MMKSRSARFHAAANGHLDLCLPELATEPVQSEPN